MENTLLERAYRSARQDCYSCTTYECYSGKTQGQKPEDCLVAVDSAAQDLETVQTGETETAVQTGETETAAHCPVASFQDATQGGLYYQST